MFRRNVENAPEVHGKCSGNICHCLREMREMRRRCVPKIPRRYEDMCRSRVEMRRDCEENTTQVRGSEPGFRGKHLGEVPFLPVF